VSGVKYCCPDELTDAVELEIEDDVTNVADALDEGVGVGDAPSSLD
jgi:hypothetical protein